jgi:hypothetical protein
MGKADVFRSKPRNIVAKFSFFKDCEYVRGRALLKLKGTNIWVNERFPPEVEDKRRKLYPMMRAARKQNKRVKLVVDKLYIDGDLQEPKDTHETEHKMHSTEQVAGTPRASGTRERSVHDSCPTAPPREKRARRLTSTPSK